MAMKTLGNVTLVGVLLALLGLGFPVQAEETNILEFVPAFVSSTLRPPANMAAQGQLRSHAIKLTWKDKATREDGFIVERASYQGTDFVRIGITGPNVTTFYDTDFTTGFLYDYRVKAFISKRESAPSNVASGACYIPLPPAAPSDLVAIATSSTSIKLTWKDNSLTESDFWVYRGPAETGPWDLVKQNLGANATTWDDTGCTASTTYWYCVMAVAGSSTSNISNKTSATTPAPAQTNPVLNGPATATHYFDLVWSYAWPAGGSANDKYVLEFRNPSTNNNWVELASYPACPTCEFRTSPIYQEILPDRTDIGNNSEYRVTAYNNGVPKYSNIVAIYTPYLDMGVSPSSDNAVMKNSLDDSVANQVYTNAYDMVGTAYVSTGLVGIGVVNSYLTAASAFQFNDYRGHPLSTFIQGRTIEKANLVLTPYNIPIPGTTYSVQPFAAAYNPVTLTYNNLPAFLLSPLSLAYPPSAAGAYWVIDIKNIVQAWANATVVNRGLLLRDYGIVVDPQGNIIHPGFTITYLFDNFSMETGPTYAHRPRLELIIK
jgi:hypothetical protein